MKNKRNCDTIKMCTIKVIIEALNWLPLNVLPPSHMGVPLGINLDILSYT